MTVRSPQHPSDPALAVLSDAAVRGARVELIDGVRQRVVRCRLPFGADLRFDGPAVLAPEDALAARERTRAKKKKPAMEADGAEADLGDRPADKIEGPMMLGSASSTGVDSYGTEMSRAALDMMAAQARAGAVVYLAKHPGWAANDGEWDDVIGYLSDATVAAAEVDNPAVEGEQGFRLDVEVQLDGSEERAIKLADRVERGLPVGQSIGGWFTELRFIYAEDADPDSWDPPERVIVEAIELDHVAATRRPSNTDSWCEALRSAVVVACGSIRSAVARPAPDAPVVRSADPGEPAPDPLPAEPAPVEPVSPVEPTDVSAGTALAVDPPNTDEAPEFAPADPSAAALAADVAPPADASAPPAADPSVDNDRTAPLDTGASARHDSDDSGRDAVDGAPGGETATLPSTPQPSDGDDDMTPEQLSAILDSKLAPLASRLDAIEGRAAIPAPPGERAPAAAPAAPAGTDAETDGLRARNAALEAQLAAGYRDGRRGRVPVGQLDGARASVEVDALCRSAESEKDAAPLVAVVRTGGFAERRTVGVGSGFEKIEAMRATVEGDLYALLNAGVDGGLIRDPGEASGSWA